MRFRRIVGFETLYHISEDGRVLSLGKGDSTDSRTKESRILKTRLSSKGYVRVKLCKKGVNYHKTIHRLVAIAFVDNPNNLPEVNHIDGDKQNNYYKNLEWVSSSDNQKHAFRLGLQVGRRGADHCQSIPIIQLDLNENVLREFESIKSVKRELGFNTFGIIKCCKKEKKYKTAYGYKWQYKKQTDSDTPLQSKN